MKIDFDLEVSSLGRTQYIIYGAPKMGTCRIHKLATWLLSDITSWFCQIIIETDIFKLQNLCCHYLSPNVPKLYPLAYIKWHLDTRGFSEYTHSSAAPGNIKTQVDGLLACCLPHTSTSATCNTRYKRHSHDVSFTNSNDPAN